MIFHKKDILSKFIYRYVLIVIALVLVFSSKAQLCTGSFGDPLINITFGTGENFGLPLPSTTNAYTYQAAHCPDDGFYTIAHSSPNCFNGSWHPLTEDHTPGDTNGYMLIINASQAPGDFYVQKIDGLCEGTTYEMATWVMNIAQCSFTIPILPNVTFKVEAIDGTVLMKYETGDIPQSNAVQWKKYGGFFTMPTGTSSVVIRLTNNAKGGCGNDLVLDDITFRPCGSIIATSINGSGQLKEICLGDTASINFSTTIGTGNYFYQWQQSFDGTTWVDIAGAITANYSIQPPQSPGTYLYRLGVGLTMNITNSCKAFSNPLTIIVNDIPRGGIVQNNVHCVGDTIWLNAPLGASYSWTGPRGFTSTDRVVNVNNATINHSGNYVAITTSSKGCISTDSIQITINAVPIADAGITPKNICKGDSVFIGSSNNNGSQYVWQPASGLSSASSVMPLASPSQSTKYTIIVSNGSCVRNDFVELNVFTKPTVNAGPDVSIFEGDKTIMQASYSGGDISLSWSPPAYLSSANSVRPIASPPHDILYTLTAVSSHGCGSAVDEVSIKVFRKLIIPNAFSPNGDGVNDTWNIVHLLDYPNATVQVFNRYGQVVFSSKNVTTQWDGSFKGKQLPVGVFYYIIELNLLQIKYSGWVFLVK